MSDPRQWSDPTQASGGYPQNVDPAYSGQFPAYPNPYGGQPTYGSGYNQPTEQMPTYWQPGMGYPPNQPPPPPPQPPKSPRWLWIAAAAAVLLVAGLVFALVIVSSSTKESTVVAPKNPPSTSAPTSRSTTVPRVPTPTTTARVPSSTTSLVPQPTTTSEPGTGETTTAPSGVTETVLYTVTGEGRAINITYVDTGGVMQTEFNVALPWSKEVSLSAPAKTTASVAVVNVGRDVTCSVSVNGAQVRQRTGQGLTICTGAV